jgi:hypothetical protein
MDMNYRLLKVLYNSWQSRLVLWGLVLAIAGCAGAGSQPTSVAGSKATILNRLPPLPHDGGERNASAEQMATFLGMDIWDSSLGAMIDGDHIMLPATAESLEWSMYRFTVPAMGATLDNLSAMLSTIGNHGAWIAVSNYGQNTWALFGDFEENPQIPLSSSEFISDMGYVFVLVIAYDGTTVDLASTTLTYDDGAAPAVTYAGAGGAREFFAANCFGCHSAAAHTAGVVLESYDGAAAVASLAKGKVQSDHNGSYTTDEKQLIADWADGGAPLGDALHYTTDMRPQVFEPVCMNCHDSALSGVDRNGAPVSVNWDTYAAATTGDQPNHGNNRAQAGTMPPVSSGLSLTQAQKDLFQQWIDDGWPE